MDTQSIGAFISTYTGLSLSTATLLSVVVLAGAPLVYCLRDRAFRSSVSHLVAGIGIGLCVVAGWFLTGLAFDDFADMPVQLISLSYVRPSGDTLDYLMRFTALGPPGFGVVTVAGALLGGFLGSVSTGRLTLTTFADTSDTVRNLFGAALMGIGGVLALGCTVGQGMTGISTLAVGSVLAFLSIIAGGVLGMKIIERFA